MENSYTEDELALLRSKKTAREVAKLTGRTFDAIKSARKRLKALAETPPTKETDKRAIYWRDQAKQLQKQLDEVQEQRTAVEVLVEHATDLAPLTYQPPPYVAPPKRALKTSPQSAVLLFSDTHVGQVVEPGQTLGLGHYNFEIFLRRLQRLEDSTRSIIENHTPSGITELVVPMLGDMLDGCLNHAAESGQPNTMLQQFYGAGHAIAQFLRNLSVIAPLRVYGVVGNHPRWGTQKKMPTKNRASNYDMFLYSYVEALTRDIDRIKWHLDWQPFACFEVQGFPFYCGHGDNLRGGDKALGIPTHAVGRMVSTTTQLFSRAGRRLPAYYCVGHLHRPIDLPHTHGKVVVNGAFPGIDGYALNEYFNSSHPQQRLFFIHPKFGKSALYDLRLDLGDGNAHRYQLPDRFLPQ